MAGINKVIIVGNLGNDPEIPHDAKWRSGSKYQRGNKVKAGQIKTRANVVK